MPVHFLDVTGTKVKDLTPLKGTKLRTLHISDTQVKSLKGLYKLPLSLLGMRNCDNSSLWPLRHSQALKELDISGCRNIRELKLLINLKSLKTLRVPSHLVYSPVLRKLKLDSLSSPAEESRTSYSEFMKKYPAKK